MTTRLRQLLSEFRSGALSTRDFCSQFENTYNLELDKSTLTPDERAGFGPLFERVIWYSPFPAERDQVPNYCGEEEITRAAAMAAHRIGEVT